MSEIPKDCQLNGFIGSTFLGSVLFGSSCFSVGISSIFFSSTPFFSTASSSAELRSSLGTISSVDSAGGALSTGTSPPTVGGIFLSSVESSTAGLASPGLEAAFALLFLSCSSFSSVISFAPVRTMICPSSVSLIF